MGKLVESAQSGDHRKALEDLRDRLALELDDCESKRDFASLSQRYMDVLKQIAEVAGPAAERKETGLSDFEKRLAERESGSPRSRSAKAQ